MGDLETLMKKSTVTAYGQQGRLVALTHKTKAGGDRSKY